MRIIANQGYIRRRAFIGRWASMVGLGLLLIGVLISLARPAWIVPMMACLFLGFGFSILAAFYAERYAGPLRHYEALRNALKGLDDHYVLFQYMLPADHVLLEPGGCTTFVVKAQGGRISYQDGRWKHHQRLGWLRRWAGQEAVGRPEAEAEREQRKLARFLEERLPGVEVPLRTVVLFVNPNLELDVTDPPAPVFFGKKVKGWLRGPGRRRPLPADVRRQLSKALGADKVGEER